MNKQLHSILLCMLLLCVFGIADDFNTPRVTYSPDTLSESKEHVIEQLKEAIYWEAIRLKAKGDPKIFLSKKTELYRKLMHNFLEKKEAEKFVEGEKKETQNDSEEISPQEEQLTASQVAQSIEGSLALNNSELEEILGLLRALNEGAKGVLAPNGPSAQSQINAILETLANNNNPIVDLPKGIEQKFPNLKAGSIRAKDLLTGLKAKDGEFSDKLNAEELSQLQTGLSQQLGKLRLESLIRNPQQTYNSLRRDFLKDVALGVDPGLFSPIDLFSLQPSQKSKNATPSKAFSGNSSVPQAHTPERIPNISSHSNTPNFPNQRPFVSNSPRPTGSAKGGNIGVLPNGRIFSFDIPSEQDRFIPDDIKFSELEKQSIYENVNALSRGMRDAHGAHCQYTGIKKQEVSRALDNFTVKPFCYYVAATATHCLQFSAPGENLYLEGFGEGEERAFQIVPNSSSTLNDNEVKIEFHPEADSALMFIKTDCEDSLPIVPPAKSSSGRGPNPDEGELILMSTRTPDNNHSHMLAGRAYSSDQPGLMQYNVRADLNLGWEVYQGSSGGGVFKVDENGELAFVGVVSTKVVNGFGLGHISTGEDTINHNSRGSWIEQNIEKHLGESSRPSRNLFTQAF